jgi:hypothetical protein
MPTPFAPTKTPKALLIILLGAGLKIFGKLSSKESLDYAEEFVAEVERRYGALGP